MAFIIDQSLAFQVILSVPTANLIGSLQRVRPFFPHRFHRDRPWFVQD